MRAGRGPILPLGRIRALLIDLDGVIYRGESPMPGASGLLPALAELGIEYVFVTNNSTLTPRQVAAKLGSLAVATTPDHVVTSALAAADYLRGVEPVGARVLAIGEDGLESALSEAGFELVEADPTCVVVGLDRHLTYERLARACMAIRAGARFVATNADPALPVEGGFWPGTGAIVAALRAATNAQPVVVGKPSPTLLQVAMARIRATPNTTAMVGDQIGSDIAAGRAAGTITILVGHDAPPLDADPQPDVWLADLDDLVESLQRAR